jgi:hypothetical protein
MMSNAVDIIDTDRVEWAGHPSGAVVFTVWTPPEATYRGGGGTAVHHSEILLRRVQG